MLQFIFRLYFRRFNWSQFLPLDWYIFVDIDVLLIDNRKSVFICFFLFIFFFFINYYYFSYSRNLVKIDKIDKEIMQIKIMSLFQRRDENIASKSRGIPSTIDTEYAESRRPHGLS